VYAGVFDTELLSYKDPNGVTMADAVRAFGGDPDALVEAACDGTNVLGYFEVHIEQGPILERLALPVAVVTGTMGESRVKIEFLGESGHADIVPMTEHKDALFAATEFVLAAEETAQKVSGMVATVDQVSVCPNAHDLIPGAARLSLDLRHEDDSARERALLSLRAGAEAIAAGRGAAMRWHVHEERRAVPADPKLTALLARAVEEVGYPIERMPSGADHDAAAVAKIASIAMLFVRCRGGIGHNSAQLIEPKDVAVAIEVTSRFLELLAGAPRR
jgi:allantoate deiminase